MMKQCPDVVDTQDLQFKLQCRLNAFENVDISTFSNASSLLTCASRYGLIFVGTTSSSFQVIQSKILTNYDPKSKNISDYPRREVPLPSNPKHLCVNCDCTILAVVIEKDQCPVVIFYEVLSFWKQNIRKIKDLRLSFTPNVFVKEVNWNPSLPAIFTACKSDGSLGVYELKGESIDINELPAQAGATSFCWSPKGKQIAVGSRDGKITQYKPDLKAVKVIAEPKLSCPHMINSLQWVSNYQFIGVYQPMQDGTCNIIVVDAPKTGEPSYTNYEDICYSGSTRPSQFYMILQQNWNFLMVASANSAEVGVLASEGDLWTQWILPDTARAELPLNSEHQETFPVGLTFDISSTNPMPWGESTIPPCPMLLVLSHQGVLCCFNVVNLKPGIPSVCTPPDSVADTTGLSQFIQSSAASTPTTSAGGFGFGTSIPHLTPTKPASVAPSLPQSTPVVANIAPKSLFGAQTLITPIKQEGQLFGGQATITPISKNNVPTTQHSSIFSSLNPTTTLPQTNPAPVKPIVVSASPAKPPETETKPDATMLVKMLKFLESDVKTLIDKGNVVVAIGTDQEMTKMTLQLENLTCFVKEAVSISQGQAQEVHALKQNLLQAWTTYEQLKSQFDASKDELMIALTRLQPLDPIAQKRKKEIMALANYIETQLSQSSKALDEQWDDFQDYTKKTFKLKVPTMEQIFQSLVKLNVVIEEQSYTIKNIARRLCGRSKKSPLDKFTDLTEDMDKLRLDPANITKIALAKMKEREIPKTKVEALRSFLKSRQVKRVVAKSVDPARSMIKQSPVSRMRESILRLGEMSRVDLEETGLPEQTFAPKNTGLGISGCQSSAFAPIANVATTMETPVFKPVAHSFGVKATSAPFTPAPATTTASKPKVLFTAEAPNSSPFNLVPSTTKSVTIAGNLFSQASSSSLFGQSTTSIPQQSTTSISSGTASIFANLQSVIDKATAPTTTTNDVSKSTSLFGTGSAVTTTTQSLFGSLSTSSVTKSLLGTSNTQIFKPTPEKDAQPTDLTKKDLPSSSNVINVSLFGAKTDSTTASQTIFAKTAPTTQASTTLTFGAGKTTTSNQSSASASAGFSFGTATTATTSSGLFAGKTLFGAVSSSTTAITSTSAVLSPPSTPTVASPIVSKTTASNIFATSTSTASATVTKTTTATSAGSFGGQGLPGSATTTSSSIFGPATTSIFGSAKSMFGTATTSATPTTPTTSIFATPIATSTSIFGSVAATTTAPPLTTAVTETSSIFGTTSSSTIIFGGSSSSSATSIFGSTTNPTTTTTATGFGMPTSSKTTIFGSSVTAPSTSPTSTSIFGSSTAITTTATSPTGSIFGAPATSTVFGSSSSGFTASTTTAANVFGAAPSTTAQSPFGAATGAANTPFGASTSAFGSATTASSNIFGASTGSSVFGDAATTSSNIFAAPSAKSIFGSPTTTSTGVFGGSTTTASSPFGQTSSVFGTPTTTGNVFGQPAAFGATPAFGSAQPTTTASVFGQASTFGSSGQSVFGAKTTTTTTGNVFGTPVSSGSGFGGGFGTSSSGNVFGSPTTTQAQSSGAFGFGGLSVAGASSGGSIFGGGVGQSTSANPFGKVEAKPTFGSSANSIFGTPSTSSTNIFGSPATTTNSAFGSSTFGSPAAGAFGSPSAFGSSPFGQKPAFGQPATFGSTAFGSPQSGGAFSGSPTPVAQGGFGSPASFQKPSGFGAAPVFGGSPPPAFGAAPTFGSGASFGGGTFGSPEKTFGSAAPSEGFGTAAAQQNTGFGNLANQNTIGFGSLAQQANTSSSMPFSGSSSFSSWR